MSQGYILGQGSRSTYGVTNEVTKQHSLKYLHHKASALLKAQRFRLVSTDRFSCGRAGSRHETSPERSTKVFEPR